MKRTAIDSSENLPLTKESLSLNLAFVSWEAHPTQVPGPKAQSQGVEGGEPPSAPSGWGPACLRAQLSEAIPWQRHRPAHLFAEATPASPWLRSQSCLVTDWRSRWIGLWRGPFESAQRERNQSKWGLPRAHLAVPGQGALEEKEA